ncbi:MAG TPA: HD-GYP domain-containing protein [Vicinamibacterales bacterium]|jgi:HD-GYP domain-containing protein (c-di-GMP phosphodiesterase class II)
MKTPSWVSNNLQVKELQSQLLAVRTSVICALNQLLDLKDLNTGVHSTRLAEWAVRIGRDLGLDDDCLRDLEAAAILHDIGKIGTPDAILRKPSRLTAEEYAIIKKHPEYGWAVLKAVPGFERVSLFVLHHHESYDGTGYPAGLRGEETPIGSRIVSVMDSFDAMVSSRPYRTGLPLEEAIRRLQAGSGTQFDPIVTRHFIAMASSEASTVFDATGASLAAAL